jgi:pimeloyl-ACP methyl ester carboxylesterase
MPTLEPGAALIDVGGHRLHIRCEGEGSPAVVIEDGWEETGSTWGEFMTSVAETTRVCVYSRAGLGLSDGPSTPGERTAAMVADDLAVLTEASGITEPFVLVGWSAGSMLARVFAERHPGRVAGLVLVDSAHPEAGTVWGPLGIGPADDRLDWETLLADGSATGPFGDLPVRIVVQGGANWSPERQSAWVDLLSDYLALSSDSELIIVPETGHCVQCGDPEALADVVEELIAQIRG